MAQPKLLQTERELLNINNGIKIARLEEQLSEVRQECDLRRETLNMWRASQSIWNFLKVPANRMLKVSNPEHYHKCQVSYLLYATQVYDQLRDGNYDIDVFLKETESERYKR
jgi:hypothetical protein